MPSYLITGGTGFIGSALVRALCRRGYNVRVFDNHFKGDHKRLDDLKGYCELMDGDIRDEAAVSRACRGVDRVFHLAYVNGTSLFYSAPSLVLDVAVVGMVNILRACRTSGVSELFFASSSEVYQTPSTIPTPETVSLSVPDPLNPRYSYGGGKIIGELMALHSSSCKRVVVFRPHNVYGPDMGIDHVIPDLILRLLALHRRQPQGALSLPIKGTGQETRAFVHINDLIRGLMILVDKGEHRHIYHIGTQQEINIEHLVRCLARIINRDVVIESSPAPVGETSRRCPAVGKMAALGYVPEVTLEDGLEDTLSWYAAHGHRYASQRKGGN